MKERNGSLTRFGQGSWKAKREVVDRRAIYGLCAPPLHMPANTQDAICIRSATDDERFGAIHLVLHRESGQPPLPLIVDSVEYNISNGAWPQNDAGNVVFQDVSVMPISDYCIVYMMQDPDIEKAVHAGIEEFGRNAELRIGVLRHSGRPYDDRSAYVFFSLHGLDQAWRALRVFRDGGYEMLLDAPDAH